VRTSRIAPLESPHGFRKFGTIGTNPARHPPLDQEVLMIRAWQLYVSFIVVNCAAAQGSSRASLRPITSSVRGTAIVPSVQFGQGVRCVGGTLKRLYVHNAVAGTVVFPQGADPDVHTSSANHGDALTPGSTRWYMAQYRDPIVLGGCPAANTFNATQAQSVLWQL